MTPKEQLIQWFIDGKIITDELEKAKLRYLLDRIEMDAKTKGVAIGIERLKINQ